MSNKSCAHWLVLKNEAYLNVYHGIVSIPRKFHKGWLRISDQYVSCALARYLKALCVRFGITIAPKVHMYTY